MQAFINVATGGFGTELTVKTPEEQKNKLGGAAYLITGRYSFVRALCWGDAVSSSSCTCHCCWPHPSSCWHTATVLKRDRALLMHVSAQG